MKVRITARKYGKTTKMTCKGIDAARLVANLTGIGFEIVSVEA